MNFTTEAVCRSNRESPECGRQAAGVILPIWETIFAIPLENEDLKDIQEMVDVVKRDGEVSLFIENKKSKM